ncbi:MAG: hypothetical protein WCX79_01055 [Candidatus Paceibacterota bacterium]|jgi:uncharacterized protein (UPF0335 family)
MKDMIELIADREMVDSMKDASKWFEISGFVLVMNESNKWYHLFDINEQDLATKFGYDVQEQYWECQFKNDCPESVKDFDDMIVKFEDEMKTLNKDERWVTYGDVLGEALFESKYVQDAIREKKKECDMHDAQELDAGLGVIGEIVKGEMEK